MNDLLLSVVWDVDPVIFRLGQMEVRWYGLLYAIGFLGAIWVIDKSFKHDGAPESWTDNTFFWMVVATIVGARLGHVFFYDWEYYSQNLSEIPKIWHGGLASHGGAIAVVLCCWLLSKYMTKQNMWWLGDRLFLGAPFLAACIRIGNLMNSEIYGHPTDMPWGFIFVRGEEQFFDDAGNLMACHPTQLYEALAYLITLALTNYFFWKCDGGKYLGLCSGIGFTGVFLTRPIIEILKNDQSAFEADMMFNMGQLLSVPFIVLGVYLIVHSVKKGKQTIVLPQQNKKA